jgi:predicted GNAT superfamily acetyltransferase
MVDGEITIRRAETAADYRACQEAQRRAWGIAEEGYVIPVATMVGANLHGGLVLGAFLAGGEAAAVSFAFLCRIEGRICLYSQLTGVVPAYQSRGLGYEIKKLQRAIARSEGIELIVWAFDPLQAGNAHFNLTRLGATARRYIENMYGERTDSLNAGVPTDRLIAEWETSGALEVATAPLDIPRLPHLIEPGQRGADRVESDSRAAHLRIEPGQGGADRVERESNAPDSRFLGIPPAGRDRLLLEIPQDISRLRRESPALAESWRLAVKSAFTAAFSVGYRAVSFVRDESSGKRRVYYVLDRM